MSCFRLAWLSVKVKSRREKELWGWHWWRMAYKGTSQVFMVGELGISAMSKSLGTACRRTLVVTLASFSLCSFLTTRLAFGCVLSWAGHFLSSLIWTVACRSTGSEPISCPFECGQHSLGMTQTVESHCLDLILVSVQPESQFKNIQGNPFCLLSHSPTLGYNVKCRPFWASNPHFTFYLSLLFLFGLLLLSLRPDGFPNQNC